MAHIFISYAKKDTRQLAEALFDALNAIDGLSAWMDKSLEADESWAGQIEEEIDKADYVIVLLSPDVNRKKTPTQRRSFVLNEIDYAQQDNKPILPVMVVDTKTPVQIAGVQHLNLTATPDDPTQVIKRVCQKFKLTAPDRLFPVTPPNSSRIPSLMIVGIIIALAVVGVLMAVANAGGFSANTPTLSAVQQLETVDAQFTSAVVTVDALMTSAWQATDAAHADETEAAWQATDAAHANQTESAAQAALMALSAVPSPTSTATATTRPTDLPAPSATVTQTPEPTAEVFSEITRNADWTPVERDFGGVAMVQVPAGCFEMGSESGESNEQPVAQVCFDAPFWLDKIEVTQAQFVANGGLKATANAFTGDNRPVERITWFEARDYCKRRGGRLPTEAEWEYAARGPDGWVYPWGNQFIDGNVVYRENAHNQTAEVGSRPGGASWVGALDLSGNVWEWVNTIYGIDANNNYDFSESGDRLFAYPYEANDGRETNSDNRTDVRVLRGGSWGNYSDNLRASDRYLLTPNLNLNDFGFRCARSS